MRVHRACFAAGRLRFSPPRACHTQGFDPLNLAGSFDINYMREAELKHGRICMLAWVGYVAVDNGFYVPFAPHVSSLAAHDTAVKSGNMLLLLGAVGVIEVTCRCAAPHRQPAHLMSWLNAYREVPQPPDPVPRSARPRRSHTTRSMR